VEKIFKVDCIHNNRKTVFDLFFFLIQVVLLEPCMIIPSFYKIEMILAFFFSLSLFVMSLFYVP
jgi:hypothetical protein